MKSKITMAKFDPRSFSLENSWFTRPRSIHGLSHTRRVLIHACAIAPAADLTPAEFEAVVLAAAWHDIGRTHDGIDSRHGAQSVERIYDLGLDAGVPSHVFDHVVFAVELHSTHDEVAIRRAASTGDESMLRVLWTLKDADGLDRVRIDDLDPSFLRHSVSQRRVNEAWRLLFQVP